MTDVAIVAEGVHKRYRKVRALNGLNLRVPTGAVYGVLGPNGSGKTTAVRILTTLLRFDAGRAVVAGADVVTGADRVRERIAVTGQYAAVDELLTGRENLVMFGRFLGLSGRAARRRADDLLVGFDLVEVAGRPVSQYSGGLRRRLDLAASLIRPPQVLFLDEPTTGLDPRSRNALWDQVRRLARAGTTVLLTTQYLEEADQLAERISVLDAGRVVAEGTPGELKTAAGGDRIEVTVRDPADLPVVADAVARACAAPPRIEADLRRVAAPVTDRLAALTGLVGELASAGVAVEDLGIRRPTLDEAFLQLTGRTVAQEVVV